MPDFVLLDDQNVDVAINVSDDAGNVVQGESLDAGSVTATVSDATSLEATVSADQTSVNVKALGPEVTDVTVTVDGTLNGTALTSGTLAVDVNASPAVAIGLVPGTPVHN